MKNRKLYKHLSGYTFYIGSKDLINEMVREHTISHKGKDYQLIVFIAEIPNL